MLALLLAFGCHPAPEDSGHDTVSWSADLGPLADEVSAPRGFVPLRSIIHLHSPYSHDACDGHGFDA